MQFIARFDLTPAKETTALCRRPHRRPSSERIYEEWKNYPQGTDPSKGLDFSSHKLAWVFPRTPAWSVANRNQNGTPKATMWTHLCIAWMRSPKTERVKIGKIWLSALPFFAMTSGSLPLQRNPGRKIRSPKHEAKGEEPTRLLCPNDQPSRLGRSKSSRSC